MRKDFVCSLMLPTLQSLPAGNVSKIASIAGSLAYQFAKDVNVNDIYIAELGQALISSFLIENMRSFANCLVEQPKLASEHQVNRLEDYVRANWDSPLTVEDVAAACDVSVRSAFARFKYERGISPMAYLRDVRLSHAHGLLLRGEGNTSVIDVALRCGFSSLGHFAKRYKDKYGELPSEYAISGRSKA